MKTRIKRVVLDLLRKLVKKYYGITIPRFVKGDRVYWVNNGIIDKGMVVRYRIHFNIDDLWKYIIEVENGIDVEMYSERLCGSYKEAKSRLQDNKKFTGALLKSLGEVIK